MEFTCGWCHGKGRELNELFPEGGTVCRNCNGTGHAGYIIIPSELYTVLNDVALHKYDRYTYFDKVDLMSLNCRYIRLVEFEGKDRLVTYGDMPSSGCPTNRDMVLGRHVYLPKDHRAIAIQELMISNIRELSGNYENGLIEIKDIFPEDIGVSIEDSKTDPFSPYLELHANVSPTFSNSTIPIDPFNIFYKYEWFIDNKEIGNGELFYDKNTVYVKKKDMYGGKRAVVQIKLKDKQPRIYSIGDNITSYDGKEAVVVRIMGGNMYLVRDHSGRESGIVVDQDTKR